MPTGRRTAIKTLEQIMTSPEASIAEKLEALKIWNGLGTQPKIKKETITKPRAVKSTLLG